MKIVKSVSLLETSSGDKQFSPTGSRSRQPSKKEVPVSGHGAVGLRTTKDVLEANAETAAYNLAISGFENTIEEAFKHTGNKSNLETAFDSSSGGGNSEPATIVSDVVSRNSLADVMVGITPRNQPEKHNTTLCNIFRDMHRFDATSGSAIDLLSTMPFSDFALTGMKDEKMARPFYESVENMRCSVLLPNISINYHVLGGVVLSTKWDESKKIFRGVTSHDLDNCNFQEVPVFGIDPSITVNLSSTMIKSLENPEILDRYKELIPDDIMKFVEENKGSSSSGRGDNKGVTLNPDRTIFIPRRGFMEDYSGVSLLQRALPAWLYEKALIRGTVDQVYKRQRSTTHITVAPTEEMVVTQDELNRVAQMFVNAELDPLGSIVATRDGISVNEVRRGDDFWRWDQNFDTIEKIKLRALGISESFITGDANYSTMEQSLSVFMEGVRDYRNRITREIFYEKIFPTISNAWGFTRKKYGGTSRELAKSSGLYINERNELIVNISSQYPTTAETALDLKDISASDYVIPQLQWHKRLMPEADDAYLAVLSTLEEKGVPVSIRHWIASGGMSVESLMDGLDEDLETRTKILEYKQQLQEIEKEYGVKEEPPQGGEGGNGDEGGAEEFARFILTQKINNTQLRPSILGRGDPAHPSAEIADYDSRGLRRVMTRQGRQYKLNKYNRIIAETASKLAKQENYRNRLEYAKTEKSTKFYT